MGRMNLRCACGQTFIVDSSTFDTAECARCPGCGGKVGIDGPILEGPPPRKRAAKPAVKDMKKTHLILGGVGIGAVLFFGILILILSMSSGESDQEVMDSGHGPRAVSRRSGDVRYPTNLLNKPTTPAPPPKPAVAPENVKPLPPLPPPVVNRPAPAPVPKPAPPKPVPPPPTPKPAAPRPAAAAVLAPDLMSGIRENVLSLHEHYLKTRLAPTDRQRLNALVAAGKGTPEDVTFLNSLLTDIKLEQARHETRSVQSGYENLQREAFKALPMDQVTLTDGRTLPGRIVEVTATSVRLERKISKNVGGIMTFPRSQVREVGKGKGVGGEFKSQWEAAQAGPVAKLEALLAWCGSKNLRMQQELVAHAILMKDPGHADARLKANLGAAPVAAAPDPVGGTDPPPPTSGAVVEYQGRKWAPSDLKDSLLRKGYVVINGKWYRGEKKLVSVPGLFRYLNQSRQTVRISSTTAPVNADKSLRFSPKITGTLGTGFTAIGWTLVPDSELDVSKFFAPTLSVTRAGATNQRVSSNGRTASYEVKDKVLPKEGDVVTGEVLISVPVGKPLISASIMTLAEVESGGRITVYLQKGVIRTKLYTITRDYSRTFEMPAELVRGLTQMDLVAVVQMPAAYTEKVGKHTVRPLKMDGRSVLQYGIEAVHTQKIPVYHAKLFPSGPRTREVFRLRGMVGEPAVALDKVFEPFPELLR